MPAQEMIETMIATRPGDKEIGLNIVMAIGKNGQAIAITHTTLAHLDFAKWVLHDEPEHCLAVLSVKLLGDIELRGELALAPASKQFARDRLANGQACLFCPEMVVVPAGNFSMGSTSSEIAAVKKEFNSNWYDNEGPQHRVTIQRPFAVGRFAVTFAEWDACLADGGCNGHKPSDQGWGRDKQPVINVSWDDAKGYAAWLSRKTGKTYRLLSEAEREYAARAGTTTAFWWGPSISTRQANYDGNFSYAGSPKGEYRQRTLPVDSFEANPWGLYQVHGNVWEWMEDCWHDSYQGAPGDGSAWATNCSDAGRRVVRGGSWYSYPRFLRSANRYWFTTVDRVSFLGFRLARTLNP